MGKQLQHDTGPEGGQPCRRCGIRYSPKTAYVPCFEEGDTLETWMGRQSRTVLDLLPESVVRGELEKRRAFGVVG
jgi:hypothetical protein